MSQYLLILWVVGIALFTYFGNVQIFGQIDILNPVLRVAICLVLLPIFGLLFMYIGKVFAYPLIHFFNL